MQIRVGVRAFKHQSATTHQSPMKKLYTSDASAEIKKISQFFDSDLCGITNLDERWLYSKWLDVRDMSEVEIELPDRLTSVVVLGH